MSEDDRQELMALADKKIGEAIKTLASVLPMEQVARIACVLVEDNAQFVFGERGFRRNHLGRMERRND